MEIRWIRDRFSNDRSVAIASASLAFLVYLNTLGAEFVYDDSRAIINNQDLRPETPWLDLVKNDFWGTPLVHSGSHKSYRPLTVATFRLNYYFGELNPFGYHLINVLLHSAVTYHVARLARSLGLSTAGVACVGALFAVHPVHTEAVAGVVGRADLLATFFCMLALRAYLGASDSAAGGRWSSVVICMCSSVCAVLAKEYGLSVLVVCFLYDLVKTCSSSPSSPSSNKGWLQWLLCRGEIIKRRTTRSTYLRWTSVILLTITLAIGRLWLMGFTTPTFSPSDNPASHHPDALVRFLTFAHLAIFNLALLARPETLSFDWSMDAIPLVQSIGDPRNLLTLVGLGGLAILGVRVLSRILNGDSGVVEPSPRSWAKVPAAPMFDHNGNACTPDDPGVWSGRISPKTAQALTCNLPNCTGVRFKFPAVRSPPPMKSPSKSSSFEFPAALRSPSKPNQFDYHHHSPKSSPQRHSQFEFPARLDSNLAVFLAMLIMIVSFLPASNLFVYVGFVVAERVLYLPSVGYCLLIGIGLDRLMIKLAHHRHHGSRFFTPRLLYTALSLVIIFYSLKTVRRNLDWRNEEALYTSGIGVNPAKSYSNLGNIWASMGGARRQRSIGAYRRALGYRPNMADTHYNLGLILQEDGDLRGALKSYENAVQFRPRMAVAHLNMGIVLASLERQDEAEARYKLCTELSVHGLKDPKTHENAKLSCGYNLGRLLTDRNRLIEAVRVYRETIDRLNPFYRPHSLYNALGDALFKLDQFVEAESWFKKSLSSKPDHVPAHLTYGYLLYKTKRPDQAGEYFERARRLSPDDLAVWEYSGRFYSDTGRHRESLDAFQRAYRLNPDHFDVVFGVANAYRNLGITGLAEEFYEKAVVLRPKSSTARMNFGAILHLNKKYDRAELEYLEALKFNPDDQLVQENLKKLQRARSASMKK